MSWSVLQSAAADAGSGNPAVAFTSNLTAGTKLVAAVTLSSSNAGGVALSAVATVSDGNGNSFTFIGGVTEGTEGFLGLWAMDTPAGDAGTKPTITAAINGSVDNFGNAILVQEVSGLATGNTLTAIADGTLASNSGHSTGPATTGAYTSSAASEYLLCVYGDPGFGVTYSTPAGYTADAHNITGASDSNIGLFSKNSAATAESASLTLGGTDGWMTLLVALKTGTPGSVPAGVATASAAAPQPGIGGQVTSVGVPVNVHSATGSVTGAWPAGAELKAGHLLVAVVTAAASTSAAAISTPSGWTKQVEEGNSATAHARTAIYTATASGGDAAPSFTSTESGTAGGMNCMLFELIGADTSTVIDTSGVFGSGSSTTTLTSTLFTCTTGAAPVAGGYAFAVFSQERAAASLTFTDAGTGWTKLLNGSGVSTVGQAAILVQQNPPTSGTLNDHGAFSTTTTAYGAAIVAVIKAAQPGTAATAGVATATAVAPATASTPHAGVATAAGSAAAVSFSTYITGLGGSGAGYFADNHGNPRMVLGDAAWALCGNAGRWNSGDWQGDFDTYLANRAGQGFTAIYTKPIGTTQSGNIDDNGKTFDALYPFQGGSPSTGVAAANPSSGLTASFWARIDYFLASALAKGVTVFLNAIGYSSDFDGGPGPLAGKSTTEFQAYGAALGARYASQPNLVWNLADDYFGDNDALITAFLTGLTGAGDTHAVSIENMAESTSRKTLDAVQVATTWGAANAEFNFCYSYNVTYYGVEKAYLESSPIPVIQGDGYFYQGGSSYAGGSGAFAYDRAIRQDAWHAISSGARGIIHGSESIWQWASTALAASGTDWYYANNAGNIRALIESLPGWHTLVPDTSSALVTAGRGTHASARSSGGGGGQYEVAFSDSYVTGSRTPDTGSGSALAVIYLSHGTTITIDQTKMAAGYTATWVDPVSGATSGATAGSTYNSTAKGSNSAGDPDWVLVLQASTAVSANAAVAVATGAAPAPAATITAKAAASAATAAAPAPVTAVTASAGPAAASSAAVPPASQASATAGAATTSGQASAGSTMATAGAGAAAGHGTAPQPLVSVSGSANAGVAAVSATSPAAVVTVTSTATAGVASAEAAAPDAASASTATASAAEVQATAPAAAPTGTVAVAAGSAAAQAVARPVTAAQTATAGASSALAAATPVTLTGTVTAGIATAPAVAPAVSASASGSTTAFAEVAGALGTAAAPQSAARVPAGVAPASAAAPAATAAAVADAGAASAPVTAGTPSPAVTAQPGAALSVAVGSGASVSASGSVSAHAEAATVTAGVASASAAASPAPGTAAASAAAAQPSVFTETAATAFAAVAAATATASVLRAAATAQALAALSAATAADATTGTTYGTARAGQMTIPRATAGQQTSVPRAVAGQWD